MQDIRLSAQLRDKKITNQRLRRDGKVPGVYYNKKRETRNLQFDSNQLNQLLKHEIGILNVDVTGADSFQCLIREVQRHPTRGDVIHIDLYGILGDQKIKAHVPFHMVGTAPGVKEGGVLDLVMRDIEVECLPKDLPTHIELNISSLGVNDGIRISDLAVSGLLFHGDPHATIVHVVPPKTEAAAAAAPVASAEPEVLREKKVEPEKDDKKK